jgi:type IV secretion system protein VirB3
MSDKAVKIHKDLLFVALTRVPTIAGIPYMAFVLEMMFASMMIIMVGKLQYVLLVVPVHGVLYLISARDPGIFAEIEIWMKTAGRCLNRGFWGATSFSPLSTKKWKQ